MRGAPPVSRHPELLWGLGGLALLSLLVLCAAVASVCRATVLGCLGCLEACLGCFAGGPRGVGASARPRRRRHRGGTYELPSEELYDDRESYTL